MRFIHHQLRVHLDVTRYVCVCVSLCEGLFTSWLTSEKDHWDLGKTLPLIVVHPSDFIPVSPCVNPCVSESGWSGKRFSSATVISVLFRHRKKTPTTMKMLSDAVVDYDGMQIVHAFWFAARVGTVIYWQLSWKSAGVYVSDLYCFSGA